MPFVDLVLAVVRRTRAGRSPFAPDKQHLHHRLLEIGHSHRRAVLIMWLWAGLIAFGGVASLLYATAGHLGLLRVGRADRAAHVRGAPRRAAVPRRTPPAPATAVTPGFDVDGPPAPG